MADVRDFAERGALLLMFVAGLETNLPEVRRVGRVAFWSAFGGVILPSIGGSTAAVLFGLPLYWQAIFVGTILTATSISISAQTLFELGALRSREGWTILGAAVIDDVMGILVLSVVVAVDTSQSSVTNAAQIGIVLPRVAGYFVIAVGAGRRLSGILAWRERGAHRPAGVLGNRHDGPRHDHGGAATAAPHCSRRQRTEV